MDFKNRSVLSSFICKDCVCCLAFAILAGFIVGIYTASCSSFPFSFLMHSTVSSTATIVRKLCSVLLPFSITAFAVAKTNTKFLYVLVFVEAFLYCFCLHGVCECFGQVGWLVSCLTLLTPGIVLFELTWFSIRHINSFSSQAFAELFVLAIVGVIVCLLETLVLIPFLSLL